jgi:hypothetical protein
LPNSRSPSDQSQSTVTPAPSSSKQQCHAHRNLIRATLAMMSIGMAYMLIAMQFGTASMPGMPGM